MMNNFGVRLRELRKSRGLTGDEMAAVLGVQRRSLVNYEAGAREPSLDQLITLADFFNVSTDHLLGRVTAKDTFIAFDLEDPVDTFQIVRAEDEEELWGKLATAFAKNENFRDYINDMSINMGLASRFFHDELGYLYDDHIPHPRIDLSHMTSEAFEAYSQSCVAMNAGNYFNEAPILGKIYLYNMLRADDVVEFPDELYEYCFVKEVRYSEEPYFKLFLRKIAAV